MGYNTTNKKLNGRGEAREVSQGNSTTLGLLGSKTRKSPFSSSSSGSESIEFDLLELGQGQFLPFGWEKCLDLKTGSVFYLNSGEGTEVSSEVNLIHKSSEFSYIEGKEEDIILDLELNLSVSNVHSTKKNNGYISTTVNTAQEAQPAMRLVGCKKCLMYFMLCSQDVKCPKCRDGSLLDFMHTDPLSQ